MSDEMTILLWFVVVAAVLAGPYIFFCKYFDSNKKDKSSIKQPQTNNSVVENSTKQISTLTTRRTQTVKDSSVFDSELASIPRVNIEISSKFIKTNYVKEMEKVRFSRPRNNAKLSGYGNFVVIDTETTGISASNEIIELSAIKYKNFKPVSAFSTLIKPKYDIPKNITEITHITNEMVKNSPSIYSVMPAFIEYVGNSDILGHNLDFDLRFVYKYGFKFQEQKRRYFDSLDIARSSMPGLDNYKLTTLCEYYGISRSNAHRSLSDCYATAKVYILLLNNYSLIK